MKVKSTDAAEKQISVEDANLIRLDSIFRNNGYDPETNGRMSMSDAMDIPSAAFMVPRVLTSFVQEGNEPMLIGANLLQRIDYVPGMQTVFPALDILTAREVGDGMSLPIFNVNIGGGQTFGVSVTRHGLQLRVNKKFVDQSAYPWLQWWMKLAGQALARHKEEYIFSFITMLGTVVFDNDVSKRNSGYSGNDQPIKGATTGRNIKGQFNGSFTPDDIFDMYAQNLMNGFIPDTLLVHPMTWLMFIKDPVMREFAMAAGGGSFFANFTGNAAAQAYAGQFNFNGLGYGLGNRGEYKNGVLTGGNSATKEGLPQNQNSAPVLPNYLGIPFKILVSPFVKFDPINRLTDVMMFDSRNLGALIVDEDPHVNSWDEQQFNIQNIGIEETYGFGILNEGQAITVAKNIAVKPNEFIHQVRPYLNINEDGDANVFETNDLAAAFSGSPLNVLAR